MVRLPRCFVYHSCAAAVLLAIAGIAPSSVGQEASGDDSTIVYPAEYFAEYAPITAQDMLDRIPGQGQASDRLAADVAGRRVVAILPLAGGDSAPAAATNCWSMVKERPARATRPAICCGAFPPARSGKFR